VRIRAGAAGRRSSAPAVRELRARPQAGPALTARPEVADLLRLQALAGNAAVGQLLAGDGRASGRLPVQLQAVARPPPPAPLPPATPEADPKFQAVTGKVHQEGA